MFDESRMFIEIFSKLSFLQAGFKIMILLPQPLGFWDTSPQLICYHTFNKVLYLTIFQLRMENNLPVLQYKF